MSSVICATTLEQLGEEISHLLASFIFYRAQRLSGLCARQKFNTVYDFFAPPLESKGVDTEGGGGIF